MSSPKSSALRATIAPALLALASLPAMAVQGVQYQVREVQVAAPALVTQLNAISKNGTVAGDTYTTYPNSAQGFTFDGSQTTSLAALPVAFFTSPLRVFDDGSAIGFSGIDLVEARPVLWSPNGAPLELRRLRGDDFGVALGATGGGLIVGLSTTNLGVVDRPVIWNQGVLTQLPLPAGKANGRADGINAKGLMVGSAWNFGPDQEGFVMADGKPKAIGTLQGGTVSALFDVNDSGVAVGAADSVFGLVEGIFWEAGTIRSLPPLSGDQVALLLRLNRRGTAVGVSQTQTTTRGVVTGDGQLLDLNTRLDPVTGAGWFILAAQDINDRGQIAGVGVNPLGQAVGCILTPVLTKAAPAGPVEPPSPDLTVELRERMRTLYRFAL